MTIPHTHSESGLTGKLLIAMPSMGDQRFARSVVLVCTHTRDGAMGLILNRPLDDMAFPDLLGQLDITPGSRVRAVPVHFGGPCDTGRGFVLHEREDDAAPPEGVMAVSDALAVTTTRDILEVMAQGKGPARAILALGYAGWAAGQLDGEILANGWLTADASDDLLFGRANSEKWRAALNSLGVDPQMLSAASGRA